MGRAEVAGRTEAGVDVRLQGKAVVVEIGVDKFLGVVKELQDYDCSEEAKLQDKWLEFLIKEGLCEGFFT